REIAVSTTGASGVVVWNSWEEKGSRFADLGPGDWQRFVCVEAGCVLDGAVHLEPGRTHTLSTTVSL
ncbi:MAG: D-hexose-6-phosphate mutarotase, partial [Tetrasphaera sp.]|nr:D-hexose-6-phosphate mutarotase [Tetrasphaera sp.]